jgi:hypothetical protein
LPYKIIKLKKKGDHYKVINKNTGDVKAYDTTLKNAKAQIRFLGGVTHGMKSKKVIK